MATGSVAKDVDVVGEGMVEGRGNFWEWDGGFSANCVGGRMRSFKKELNEKRKGKENESAGLKGRSRS